MKDIVIASHTLESILICWHLDEHNLLAWYSRHAPSNKLIILIASLPYRRNLNYLFTTC